MSEHATSAQPSQVMDRPGNLGAPRAPRSAKASAMAGLTPLLDVIFLLLFALLISSETKTESDTELVPIQLPEVQPSEGSSETESQRLALTLDAESRVYVESATEALDSLDEVDAALASVL